MGLLMVTGRVVYCIDTSSLIHAWVDAYPPGNFEGFWSKLDELIAGDCLVASGAVLKELERKRDKLLAWVSERDRKKELFKNVDKDVSDEIERLKDQITEDYPELVNTKKGRARVGGGKSWADPYVIARALVEEPSLVVVTDEKPKQGGGTSIPNVCNSEGIECTNILGLIQREDWQFE